MKTSQKAFTLIELLIVIAIIGILMALLYPTVTQAIEGARKTQAKNDAVQIATAVVAYETEYGKLPADTTTVNKALVETLSGIPNNTNNPRQIVFLEVQAWKKGKSGTNASGQFLDPWGGVYQIALDIDYDNTVSGGTTPETIRRKVAVWNNPSLHTNGTDSQKARRYVTSWQ